MQILILWSILWNWIRFKVHFLIWLIWYIGMRRIISNINILFQGINTSTTNFFQLFHFIYFMFWNKLNQFKRKFFKLKMNSRVHIINAKMSSCTTCNISNRHLYQGQEKLLTKLIKPHQSESIWFHILKLVSDYAIYFHP